MTQPPDPTSGYQPAPSPLDLPPLPQPNVPTGPTSYGQPTQGYTPPPQAAVPGYGQSLPAQPAQPTQWANPPQATPNPYAVPNFNQPTAAYTPNVAPYQPAANPVTDAQQNKAMAVLAYLGPLVLVPLFAAKHSPFARFHTNQGLVLLVAWVLQSILQGILGGFLLNTLLWLVGVAILVLAILGIVNAVNGKTEKLPLVGNIQLLK
ncbi:MAG: hypothetical protein LBR33_09930 [Propionibacteriaceae bacterium]|jgi:uncharacterized membrane protein|nr:hypothetical protein [Propionibacteriaceae bacterium]